MPKKEIDPIDIIATLQNSPSKYRGNIIKNIAIEYTEEFSQWIIDTVGSKNLRMSNTTWLLEKFSEFDKLGIKNCLIEIHHNLNIGYESKMKQLKDLDEKYPDSNDYPACSKCWKNRYPIILGQSQGYPPICMKCYAKIDKKEKKND